jgi:hypothetical protein
MERPHVRSLVHRSIHRLHCDCRDRPARAGSEQFGRKLGSVWGNEHHPRLVSLERLTLRSIDLAHNIDPQVHRLSPRHHLGSCTRLLGPPPPPRPSVHQDHPRNYSPPLGPPLHRIRRLPLGHQVLLWSVSPLHRRAPAWLPSPPLILARPYSIIFTIFAVISVIAYFPMRKRIPFSRELLVFVLRIASESRSGLRRTFAELSEAPRADHCCFPHSSSHIYLLLHRNITEHYPSVYIIALAGCALQAAYSVFWS